MHCYPIVNTAHQSTVFVTVFIIIDEPKRTRCNYPKSIVYFTLLSWCYICYWCRQMYNDMYPSLWYHTVFSVPWKPFVLHLFTTTITAIPPLPLPTPGNHWSFTVVMVLLFPECHKVVIIQYVVFSDWLFSLSNMHLRFFQCLFMAWEFISF